MWLVSQGAQAYGELIYAVRQLYLVICSHKACIVTWQLIKLLPHLSKTLLLGHMGMRRSALEVIAHLQAACLVWSLWQES